MPWSNQGGGPWGSGGGGGGGKGGPWGSGPQHPGPTPPDLEEFLRRSQDRLRTVLPGGNLGGKGLSLVVLAAIAIWGFSGFFRVDPLEGGRSLISYGAVVNLGFGFAQLLFEEKIKRYALDTPRLLRRYVEENHVRTASLEAGGARPAAVPK